MRYLEILSKILAIGPSMIYTACNRDIASLKQNRSRQSGAQPPAKEEIKMNKAFTLIELLVVVGILVVLMAIAFPILGRAKQEAKRATAIEHLRQCGMALFMYADDNEGLEHLPVGPSARAIFAQAPTCDPADTWRTGCSGISEPQMVGSFAYVRMVSPYNDPIDAGWAHYIQKPDATLMVSIFHGSHIPVREDYDDLKLPVRPDGHLPVDRVVRLLKDGSVKTTHNAVDYDAKSGVLFSWFATFAGYGK